MTVGYPRDKQTIDNRAGRLAKVLRDTLDDVTQFKAWLDTQTDQALTGLGYSTDDVALLKSAFTDLSKLAAVAHGQQTQADPSDFFFWASHLIGPN